MKSIILSLLVFSPKENFLTIKTFETNGVGYVTVYVHLKSNNSKSLRLMRSGDLKNWEDTGLQIKDKTTSYTERTKDKSFYKLEDKND